MGDFTMLGFDGLGDFGAGRRGRRYKTARRATGRYKRRVCGCRVSYIRGPKGRGRVPVASCPGTPMKRFLSKAQAASRRGRTFCVDMARPFTTGRRGRRGKACSRKIRGAVWRHCRKSI